MRPDRHPIPAWPGPLYRHADPCKDGKTGVLLGSPAHGRRVYFHGQLRQSDAMNARTDQVLIETLSSLAPQQRAEVEDFVDFLKAHRERDRDDAARRLVRPSQNSMR